MENQVFKIDGNYRRLALTGGGLLVTNEELESTEEIERAVRNPDGKHHSFGLPFARIQEAGYNTKDDYVKLTYVAVAATDGKSQELQVEFGDDATARAFGEFIGTKLSGSRIETRENRLTALFGSAIFLLGVLGITWFLTTLVEDDSLEGQGGSARARGKLAFLRLITNTLGETGLWIVGGLIAALIAFGMYSRFKSPGKDVVYTR